MSSDKVDKMVNLLRQWQGLERQAMSDTAEISEKTDNSFIRLVMEIIRHDSLMHHRVQQFLIDAVTQKDVAVSREEVAEVWAQIEAHDKVERKTIELAQALISDSWNPVHKQVLTYLLEDEKKHDSLIGQLDQVKKGMSQASGG